MKRFPYEQSARQVSQAHDAALAAARAASGRPNAKDPLVIRWRASTKLLQKALQAAYPQTLIDAMQGLKSGEEGDPYPLLEFLEADTVFFGSGYMKEEAANLLGRTPLPEKVKARLRSVLLDAVERNNRREFRRYCRLAKHLDSTELRTSLQSLSRDEDHAVRRRAEWMLSALRQASRRGN